MIWLALAGWLVAIVAVAAVLYQRLELRCARNRARLMEDEAGFWQERFENYATNRTRTVESERREGPVLRCTIEQLTRDKR